MARYKLAGFLFGCGSLCDALGCWSAEARWSFCGLLVSNGALGGQGLLSRIGSLSRSGLLSWAGPLSRSGLLNVSWLALGLWLPDIARRAEQVMVFSIDPAHLELPGS